jgi:hypothetical protein
MSIIETISRAITPAMETKIAEVLDTTQGSVDKGMRGAVPGVLAAILGATRDDAGAQAFGSALARQDPALLDHLGAKLDENAHALSHSGGDLLSALLGGDKMHLLVSKLKDFSGLSEGGAATLLGMAGTFAMGALGKTAREGGLDAGGVLKTLADQKDEIAQALPADFAKALSGTGLLGAVPGATPAPEPLPASEPKPAAAASTSAVAAPQPGGRPAAAPPGPGRPWWHWVVGIALLLLILWLLAGLFGGSEDVVEETVAEEPVDGQ